MSQRENKSRIESPAFFAQDGFLAPFADRITQRVLASEEMKRNLTGGGSLADFASGHEYFGLHKDANGWVLREWAPNAERLFLIGAFSGWQTEASLAFQPLPNGVWELRMPPDRLNHGDLFRLRIEWSDGAGDRIPAYARRVVQDVYTKIFNAQVWHPPEPHVWRINDFRRPSEAPFIYEAHVGMAQQDERIGTYVEFREKILPRVIDAGYNVLQLMAIQEHPYYGSFGYHVSSWFAASSRFGTPEELKELIDAAHAAGLAVIMDLIHSHAVRNEVEGLSRFDGTPYQYFHDGPRGEHVLWDSRCFDYGRPEVLHFLLSNCRFWLDEYRFDGFRFDGITSMLYTHHGMNKAFSSYDDYFDHTVDEQALAYLRLANQVIHTVRPDAITIAEDVSGMPGLAAPEESQGIGFNYRLAMGIPDYWIKLIKHERDENWPVGGIWHELTNRRAEERVISYAESHDQALVGDQTIIFRLLERDMYDHMALDRVNLNVERGIALHKMIRLVTLGTAGHGYLNFMGNEFGHPEWIDFPREGNQWSYHYARRQWRLRDDLSLVYHFLADFDRAMIELARAARLLDCPETRLCLEHCDQQLLGFERANLLFLFNFNPSQSYPNYPVETAPGKYRMILDADATCFGGQGRLQPNQIHFAGPDPETQRVTVKVYLPARTALVLHRLS